MSHRRVCGIKPDNGPGQLAAQAMRDRINRAYATWVVTLVHDNGLTTAIRMSAVASIDDLKKAFEVKSPQYTMVGY